MVMFVLIVFVFVGCILNPLLGRVLHFGVDGAVICLLLVVVVVVIIVVIVVVVIAGLLLIVVMIIMSLLVVMIIVSLPLIMVMFVIMIIVGIPLIVVMIIMGLLQAELLRLSFCILMYVVFVAMMLSLLTVEPCLVFLHLIFVLPSTSLLCMSMTNVVVKIVAR